MIIKIAKFQILLTIVWNQDLFSAIWMKCIYQIEDVMCLFGVNRTSADNMLRASGYIKKTDSLDYILNQDRQKSVILCCEMADRLSYYDLCNVEWEEPVYGKKKEYFKSIGFCITIAFVILFCILILNFCVKAEQENSSGLSTLFSAIIAGIISVATTYAIMHQTYKIDYHQERLAVMPVFRAEIIPIEDLEVADSDDYETYIDDMCNALNIDKVVDQSQGNSIGYILKIENYGKGTAFHVNIAGNWAPYDDVKMSSFNIDQVKYALIKRVSPA